MERERERERRGGIDTIYDCKVLQWKLRRVRSARVRSFRAHAKFVIFSYCQPGHLLNELAKLIEELWTRLAIVKMGERL